MWPPSALTCPLRGFGAVTAMTSVVFSGLTSGCVGLWGRGLTWAGVGEAWLSQLFLIAVEGLDQRPWILGVTSWPMGVRPPATVLPVLARSGVVLQEPTLHSVLPEALGSHQPLRSQIPQLAKGWQLLAC